MTPDDVRKIVAALSVETFHELSLYGNAVIPDLFSLRIEESPTPAVDTLKIDMIGLFRKHYKEFLE